MKARYDVQVIVNTKLEKKIEELNVEIKKLTSKMERIKEGCVEQCDNSARQISKLQDENSKLKEQLSVAEMKLNNDATDNALAVKRLNNDVERYLNENATLKENLLELENNCNEKIQETHSSLVSRNSSKPREPAKKRIGSGEVGA